MVSVGVGGVVPTTTVLVFFVVFLVPFLVFDRIFKLINFLSYFLKGHRVTHNLSSLLLLHFFYLN